MVATRLVWCTELSRTAKALTSQGLATATDETLNTLSLRSHLDWKDRVSDLVCQFTGFEEFNSFGCNKICHRGSSTGPSGWHYDHVQPLRR